MLTTHDSPVIKESEVKHFASTQKLIEAREALAGIWKKLMPFRPNKSTRPHLIDDKTTNALFSEIKDEKGQKHLQRLHNPFYLSPDQHKNLVLTLSMLLKIVDDLSSKEPASESPDWIPLCERDSDVCFIRVSYFYFEDKWLIGHEDIPIHMVNHTPPQEYSLHEAKEYRKLSLLNTLIELFISAYRNLSDLPVRYLQKFAELLEPSDPTSCCIDARTRQALTYGLTDKTETFTDLLHNAVKECVVGKEDNYFYLLASLVKLHWGEKFKTDTSAYGIYTKKEEGQLNLDAHDLILDGFTKYTGELHLNNDFLVAFRILPIDLQSDYFKLVFKQKKFFQRFMIHNSTEQYTLNSVLLETNFKDKSFLHFLAIECDEVELAKKMVMEAPRFVLEKNTDLWVEPLSSKVIGGLENKDWAFAISTYQAYFDCAQDKPEEILAAFSSYSKTFSPGQLIQFIKYSSMFTRAYNISDCLVKMIKELEEKLNSNQLIKLLYDQNILSSVLCEIEIVEKFDIVIKLLSTMNIPDEESQRIFDHIMQFPVVSGFRTHLNLISYVIKADLPCASNFLHKISSLKLYRALTKSTVRSISKDQLVLLLTVIGEIPADYRLKILTTWNPFSYKEIIKNINEVIVLLKKEFYDNQIIFLINHSSLLTDCHKQNIHFILVKICLQFCSLRESAEECFFDIYPQALSQAPISDLGSICISIGPSFFKEIDTNPVLEEKFFASMSLHRSKELTKRSPFSNSETQAGILFFDQRKEKSPSGPTEVKEYKLR